ncbi:MAG: sigma 54-interacting transcriptional regulator [Spirochaetaceae bacterium]
MPTILIGPIEGQSIESLAQALRNEGYEVLTARNLRELFTQTKEAAVDVVVAETGTTRRRLHRVLSALETHNRNTLLIVVTDRIRVSLARSDSVARVFDLMDKPIRPAELLLRVRKALGMKRLHNETVNLRGERPLVHDIHDVIAYSPAMRDVLAMVERVAVSDSTVLLTGETGTGKEVIAAALHYNSPRAGEAFVRVNCAALPETLLESELFGHERGAFTGAETERIGRFERADGGTLLLDEVGELSGGTQVKLLRVLQERKFERVGGTRTISVDVRLIASTNRDLPAEVAAGRFREDLYYRLNVVPIHLPPLRERGEDILPLARQLLARHADETHHPEIAFSADAESALLNHDWPGNIRELENVIERALILTDSREITAADLDLSRIGVPSGGGSSRSRPDGLTEGLADVERETILNALETSNWVQKDAAKLLHISPRALNYRIRKLGIRHSRWRRNR